MAIIIMTAFTIFLISYPNNKLKLMFLTIMILLVNSVEKFASLKYSYFPTEFQQFILITSNLIKFSIP